jgi:hypothetical protein
LIFDADMQRQAAASASILCITDTLRKQTILQREQRQWAKSLMMQVLQRRDRSLVLLLQATQPRRTSHQQSRTRGL